MTILHESIKEAARPLNWEHYFCHECVYVMTVFDAAVIIPQLRKCLFGLRVLKMPIDEAYKFYGCGKPHTRRQRTFFSPIVKLHSDEFGDVIARMKVQIGEKTTGLESFPDRPDLLYARSIQVKSVGKDLASMIMSETVPAKYASHREVIKSAADIVNPSGNVVDFDDSDRTMVTSWYGYCIQQITFEVWSDNVAMITESTKEEVTALHAVLSLFLKSFDLDDDVVFSTWNMRTLSTPLYMQSLCEPDFCGDEYFDESDHEA